MFNFFRIKHVPLNFSGDGGGIIPCVVVHALSVRCEGDGCRMLCGLCWPQIRRTHSKGSMVWFVIDGGEQLIVDSMSSISLSWSIFGGGCC